MEWTGKRLSHYEILERVGAGGMGVVYRARDLRLEREVAIKVLPDGALADESSRKQFRREALALSRLSHSNIATVHDFDEQDGHLFLAMELVEGTTLSDRLRGEALPEEVVRDLGAQLEDGLAAAHRRGVLHRDIKPSNLRVTPDGVVKILDFGLAKLARPAGELSRTETLSATDTVAGTVPYMAPEQIRAESPTEATDIYGAGTVLYEMATGRRAFPQAGVGEAVGAILGKSPARPRDLNPALSRELEEIIMASLAKDPSARPASAAEVALALRGTGAAPLTRRRAKFPRISRALRWAAIGLLLALPILWVLNVGGIRDGWTTQSVAVLPFSNLSGDSGQDYFVDGMTDELITRLAQISHLKVIARTSAMHYKGSQEPLPEIARKLGVQLVVEGTVRRDGERVRMNAQLIRAHSGQQLWSGSFERSFSDILVLQSDLASVIVDKIRIRLVPGERQRLSAARSVRPEAHEAFLRAETQTHLGTADKARDLYREALVSDPGYAEAYAGLAYSYTMMASSYLPPTEVMPKAARAYGVLGYVKAFYDWDWRGAEHDFQSALRLNPGSAELHQNYAYYLLVNGRFAESSSEFKDARDLDPLSGWIAFMSIWPLYNSRHYDEAVRAARALLESDRSQIIAYHIMGQALLMKGDYAGALRAYDRLAEAKLPFPLIDCWRVYGYARAGQQGKARALLEGLLRTQRSGYVPAYGLAIAYAGLGEKDEAFRWLERGIADRSEDMVFLKVEPAWDLLRSDPRFDAILGRVGFEGKRRTGAP